MTGKESLLAISTRLLSVKLVLVAVPESEAEELAMLPEAEVSKMDLALDMASSPGLYSPMFSLRAGWLATTKPSGRYMKCVAQTLCTIIHARADLDPQLVMPLQVAWKFEVIIMALVDSLA